MHFQLWILVDRTSVNWVLILWQLALLLSMNLADFKFVDVHSQGTGDLLLEVVLPRLQRFWVPSWPAHFDRRDFPRLKVIFRHLVPRLVSFTSLSVLQLRQTPRVYRSAAKAN